MKEETTMLLFGFAMLSFLAFLVWKASNSNKLTINSFTRDEQGRIIEILEKELK